MTFFVCVSLYDGNKHCVEHKDCRNRNLTFYVEICRTIPYLSLHSDIVHVSVALGFASQLSKWWGNDRGSTGKQNTLKQGFGVFLYTPKLQFTQFRG